MKYSLSNKFPMSVKELPLMQRPREKLKVYGAGSLSDRELLCVLIRTGTRAHNVNELAARVLDLIENNANPDSEVLKHIEGLGDVGASSVCAALELGRRFSGKARRSIRNSADVFGELRHYGDREQEHFIAILLNGALELIRTEVITVGLANRTLVHPREVFREAIRRSATAVIIAHNHPSGHLEPSPEDIELTVRIQKAGKLLGIEVLDHFIFSSSDYYSMCEAGEFWSV